MKTLRKLLLGDKFTYPTPLWLQSKEHGFLWTLVLGFIVSIIVVPYPHIAMWVGFLFAGYAAIANDSIQTIGTFIASNNDKKWYWLWAFLGSIFVGTVGYSWVAYGGDVTHQRLAAKGFETAPQSFHFLQLVAPLLLLMLTRLRMPVSTTFLLLSSFATTSGIGSALFKSISGYGLSFLLGFGVFLGISKLTVKCLKNKPAKWWTPFQWVVSGLLWSIWLMQDAANIAVYLPRSLNIWEFLAFTGTIVGGLGVLLYKRGGKIQKIVTEKSVTTDVRAATTIDLIYCIILFYFKMYSKVPMSTTWVFIGLLGGRELAMSIMKSTSKTINATLKLVGKDVLYAGVGLITSILIAVAVNDNTSFVEIGQQFSAQFGKFIDKLF
jgi:phosphate/sulfate permease